jgi:hypothetical protein
VNRRNWENLNAETQSIRGTGAIVSSSTQRHRGLAEDTEKNYEGHSRMVSVCPLRLCVEGRFERCLRAID